MAEDPDLTKAQINELQKALPKCEIHSNPTKQSILPVKIFERLGDLDARPEQRGAGFRAGSSLQGGLGLDL